MTVGEMSHAGELKIGGTMEPLVEMVQIENSLQNYRKFTLKRVFLGFQNTETHELPGGSVPGPRCYDGSPLKKVQIDNSVRN